MSDFRSLALAALAAVLLAMPLGAQQAPDRVRLEARLDSLLTEYASVESRLEREREAYRERQRSVVVTTLDTQRVGPLVVVSLPRTAETARRVSEGALARMGELVHAGASPLNATTLLIEMGQPVRAFDAMRELPGHRRVWLPAWRGHEWRVGVVEHVVGGILAGPLPEDVRGWLAVDAIASTSDDRLAAAYRELASAQAVAVRDCRAGRTTRCWDALGAGEPGELWQRWYAPDQVVAWALAQQPRGATEERLFADCRATMTVETCAPWVRERGGMPIPLRGQARATLVAQVLDAGGGGAYAALRNDSTGTVRERLVRAAGVPDSVLIERWRSAVIDARPRHAAGLGGSWLVTLFWTVVLAALAMRSTRWRLG